MHVVHATLRTPRGTRSIKRHQRRQRRVPMRIRPATTSRSRRRRVWEQDHEERQRPEAHRHCRQHLLHYRHCLQIRELPLHCRRHLARHPHCRLHRVHRARRRQLRQPQHRQPHHPLQQRHHRQRLARHRRRHQHPGPRRPRRRPMLLSHLLPNPTLPHQRLSAQNRRSCWPRRAHWTRQEKLIRPC